MKKALCSLFATAFLVFATSCSGDDDGPGNNGTITVQALTNTITNQSWRVTTYTEDGIDHTSDFSGFNFTFADNFTVSASNGTDTYDGVWTITDDDDDDDSAPNPDLTLFFGAPESFVSISEDWYTLERTGNLVRLRHVSGGDGGTDYLTFERN